MDFFAPGLALDAGSGLVCVVGPFGMESRRGLAKPLAFGEGPGMVII